MKKGGGKQSPGNKKYVGGENKEVFTGIFTEMHMLHFWPPLALRKGIVLFVYFQI